MRDGKEESRRSCSIHWENLSRSWRTFFTLTSQNSTLRGETFFGNWKDERRMTEKRGGMKVANEGKTWINERAKGKETRRGGTQTDGV